MKELSRIFSVFVPDVVRGRGMEEGGDRWGKGEEEERKGEKERREKKGKGGRRGGEKVKK